MALVALVACKKEESTGFDYDLNLLYGTWRVTHVMQSNGSWFNVTTEIAESVFEPTYATFNSNGTFSGSGELGNGSGTWTATGKTIITRVGGEEYLRYDVLSLSGTVAELEMYENDKPSSRMKVRVEKQGV